MASKKQTGNIVKGYDPPSNSEMVRDYSNDPFVLEKVAKAKEFLRKHPIPDRLLKRNN